MGESCRGHGQLGRCPRPEYPRAIYQVVEDSQSPVALNESDVLDQIRRQLLPTPTVSPPKATSIPSDRDLLIQRLLGAVHPVQPVVQERSRLTDIEYASGRISN